jgi:glycosyltransferase involved in cell wall biosynthesis
MKILIVAPQPFFSIRGTPLAVRELTNVFLKSGHTVDILTFHLGEDINANGLRIYRNKMLARYVKSIGPGFSFKKIILDMVIFPKALWLILKNKYDVVHCVEESAYFMAWFKWLRPFVFVYDMDSDIPKQLVESGKLKNKFFIKCAEFKERLVIRMADGVVTICSVFTEKIKKIDAEKPVFQIEDVSPDDNMPEEDVLTDKQVILYTGNFEKYQGVDVLIEGFIRIKAKFPDAQLLIVGGEENEVTGFKEKYNDKQIMFAGKRPISEMSKFLGIADIVVSPRIKGENTPFKLYSYLASGKPILATNIVSHTQVLKDKENAMLVDPSMDGISGGLQKLLNDNNFAQTIGLGARKLFEEKYTRKGYEEKVKKYLEFLSRQCRDLKFIKG